MKPRSLIFIGIVLTALPLLAYNVVTRVSADPKRVIGELDAYVQNGFIERTPNGDFVLNHYGKTELFRKL